MKKAIVFGVFILILVSVLFHSGTYKNALAQSATPSCSGIKVQGQTAPYDLKAGQTYVFEGENCQNITSYTWTSQNGDTLGTGPTYTLVLSPGSGTNAFLMTMNLKACGGANNTTCQDYSQNYTISNTVEYQFCGSAGNYYSWPKDQECPGTSAATVTTSPATNIAGNSVTFNSSVNPNGKSVTVAYKFGNASTCEDLNNTTVQMTAINGSSPISPNSMNRAGLSTGTTYKYCAIATDPATNVITYGNLVEFKTLGPSVSTGEASEITRSSAKLNYSVVPNGKTTNIIFRYQEGATTNCTSTIPSTTLTGQTGILTSVSGNTPLTGLAPGTIYSYCATAINAEGTAYSEVKSFTTLSNDTPPNTCTLKSQGDANCDGKVNIQDFLIWKSEFLTQNPHEGASSFKSNFNNSQGNIDIADFLVWKTGFINPNITH